MAANHRAAATLLLIAFLLVAVALSGANARPTTVRPNKTPAALPNAHEQGHLADHAAPAAAQPDCEDEDEPEPKEHKPKHHGEDPEDHEPEDPTEHQHDPEDPYDEPPEHHGPKEHDPEDPYGPNELESESELVDPTCDTCEPEEPEHKPAEPPCGGNTCEPEPEPELTCTKVHGVQEGETCSSVGQCAGLSDDDFLRFNPNLCCDKLFVGQWVCLEATCGA